MEKGKFSAKKWLVMFALFIVLIALGIAAFNFVTDPFGAFGDRFFEWWSADETNNPRVAKISYLDEHHDEYDSYILGCSSTSSFTKESLDKYYGASFYNLIMYGADMLDIEQTAYYIAENYEVKNLVLNVYLDNGIHYGTEPNALTYGMHYKADGSPALSFYLKYLFASPSYGISKLRNLKNDTYLQQSFDVFDERSGAYDKSRRDAEGISDTESYFEAYPAFVNYSFLPEGEIDANITAMTMESVSRIKALCEEKGIALTVVTAPVYGDYLRNFPLESVKTFYSSLAEVTDFWDFSYSSVSEEPRYFYDETHFRNCVGNMAAARMFGDTSVYVPEDFGHFVTKETGKEYFASYGEKPELKTAEKKVPILMYHNIASEGDGGDTISLEAFTEQIGALAGEGYEAVSFDELRAYVYEGKELPEKSVVITFDDGYDSNLMLGMPVLEKYGMKATVFCIGVSAGKDTYKETGKAMFPHFSVSDAIEMTESGIFDIQSHGFDLHEVEGYDAPPIRQGVVPREGESEAEFMDAIVSDCGKMNDLLSGVNGGATVVAYPFGYSTTLGTMMLQRCGIYATVTTEEKSATVVKGLAQSLIDMGRYFVTDDISGAELIALISE